MSRITIQGFGLTIEGLSLSYSIGSVNHNLFFDPNATANLMQHMGWIDDFEIDENNEPVIDIGEKVKFWYSFVNSFQPTDEQAFLIVTYKEVKRNAAKELTLTTEELSQPVCA